MLLVIDFDAVEARGAKGRKAFFGDAGAPFAVAGVSDDGDPAGVANGSDRIFDGRSVSLDVCRAVFVEVARKRVVVTATCPALDEAGRHMLPARDSARK